MPILIADSQSGVYIASPEGTVTKRLPVPFEAPYAPLASAEHLIVSCRRERNTLCFHRREKHHPLLLPAPPSVSAGCLSPCGRYLYQLSSEADCVHTLHLGSGELCFAAPTGVFPRSMQLNPDGQQLLVAGGAVSEAYLLTAPELMPAATLHTRHPCFAAGFWKGGYVFLCIREGAELQTLLYTMPRSGVRPREKLCLPGQPGGLCVCPDGLTALISTPDGLMKAELATGRLLWNLPEWQLCMRIEVNRNAALISDTLNGQVCLLNHEEPWKQRILLYGTDAQACFCP